MEHNPSILDSQSAGRLDFDFDLVRISLASPSNIRSWSHGEIKKPETINYRTFKPEVDGLFCSRIFGPMRDYECLCGKYKRMKYKGVVCEKCGVEVTLSKVRRERMGHIDLVAPVAHVWFLKSTPSYIGTPLGLSPRELESVLYFERWIVTDPGLTELRYGQLLEDNEYAQAKNDLGVENFRAQIGAEAAQDMLKQLDLDLEIQKNREILGSSPSEMLRRKVVRRVKVLQMLKNSGVRPEWMILTTIPVIPPDLRPLVPLEGGRFATSDLNDLYRRVINRNNRLQRIKDLRAPDIIIRNEKRMLQEAVDAVFDNGRRGRTITNASRRPLKSLSDMIKGKQGRFRQNLLGKRVDYSGRSVIVVGPTLKLYQCGLPKAMALELFRPFVLSKLELYGYAPTFKAAKRMIERGKLEVWDVLEEVIRNHPVLLNRAPTLHRLGIQAFEPLLIEGKAIQLHPLVCEAFNADFDGDQMAVHVPLSLEAQMEARALIMSTNNIMSPANGRSVINPTQDMVLGLYYLSLMRPSCGSLDYAPSDAAVLFDGVASGNLRVIDGGNDVSVDDASQAEALMSRIRDGTARCVRVQCFSNVGDLELAIHQDQLHLHEPIVFAASDGRSFKTTAGRVLIDQILPDHPEISLDWVNQTHTSKELKQLVQRVVRHAGSDKAVEFCDNLMRLGFQWACKAGISLGKDDLVIPQNKNSLLEEAQGKVDQLEQQYSDGLITLGEKYNKVVDVWSRCTEDVTDAMMLELKTRSQMNPNPMFMMAESGARGSATQMRQLAGMRGLMAKPSGEIMEAPIKSNFKEGLTVLEYFNSTHGARKGLADTALKTADSGYLTRRLVDVAQDCVITEHDCGAKQGIAVRPLLEGGVVVETLGQRSVGRCAFSDVFARADKEKIIVKAGQLIDDHTAVLIDKERLPEILVRSPLRCETRFGLCAQCYGYDRSLGNLVSIGTAVGVIGAQSIGEPGTQLTMRTFHVGGAASSEVEASTVDSPVEGRVQLRNRNVLRDSQDRIVVVGRSVELIVRDDEDYELAAYRIPYGARLSVDDDDQVVQGQKLAEWEPHSIPIISEQAGHANYMDLIDGVSMREVTDETTGVVSRVVLDWKASPQGEELRPRLTLRDSSGHVLKLASGSEARYFLPIDAVLQVSDGDEIKPGDVLARIQTSSTRNRDITGGLPRVAELFEARRPKNHAILSPIDGTLHVGRDYKNRRRVTVSPLPEDSEQQDPIELLIPRSLHMTVQDGDRVRRGEAIVDGNPDPHDILAILGLDEFARYLINEIQGVYRLQGVKIDDKHFEIILRQMLQKGEITDPGDTLFLHGEHIDLTGIEKVNAEAMKEKKSPAKYRRILQGITRASLQTESFISASSFQETTRVLTEAAISGKVDRLRGLKENVIAGRLVPIGTGVVARKAHAEAVERQKKASLEAAQRRSEKKLPHDEESLKVSVVATVEDSVISGVSPPA